jgi:hypothetical protein
LVPWNGGAKKALIGQDYKKKGITYVSRTRLANLVPGLDLATLFILVLEGMQFRTNLQLAGFRQESKCYFVDSLRPMTIRPGCWG